MKLKTNNNKNLHVRLQVALVVESISAAGVSALPGSVRDGAHQRSVPAPPLLLASPCPYAAAYTRLAHCYAGVAEVSQLLRVPPWTSAATTSVMLLSSIRRCSRTPEDASRTLRGVADFSRRSPARASVSHVLLA